MNCNYFNMMTYLLITFMAVTVRAEEFIDNFYIIDACDDFWAGDMNEDETHAVVIIITSIFALYITLFIATLFGFKLDDYDL